MRSGHRRGFTKFLFATAVAALVAVMGLTAAQGVIAPGDFEGNDGNLAADAVGNTDWVDLSVVPMQDTASGSTDSSLSGSEDDTSPSYTEGSIQPNKSDLTQIRVA